MGNVFNNIIDNSLRNGLQNNFKDALEDVGIEVPESSCLWQYPELIRNSIVSGKLFEIVDKLPEDNININVIYLVKNFDYENNNIYEEYIYVNGQWEKLGNKSIDTSDFATKDDLDKYVSIDNISTDEEINNIFK